MPETTAQTFDIQTVHAIEPSNRALVIRLSGALDGLLRLGHPQGTGMQREAETSLRDGRPVGLMLDGDGRILELSQAREVAVASRREDEDDRGRLAVWFWEYSPVCYLTRDHPEFDRIGATLRRAAESGGPVWLANRMHPVEGVTEVWWRILDVRACAGLDGLVGKRVGAG